MSNLTSLDPKWKPLYTLAGIIALFNVLLIFIQIVLFSISPPPQLFEIEAWLELFASRPVYGLINLDLLLALNNIILVPVYLGIYVALKKENESAMLVGLILGLVGIAIYFPSNPCIEMLNLSSLYTQGNPSEKASLIQSATAIMMNWHGTSFVVYYFLEAIILLVFSVVMLKSSSFKKSTSWFGILSGIMMCIPSTFGTVGLIFSFLSLIPWVIFSILLGIRFIREGRAS